MLELGEDKKKPKIHCVRVIQHNSLKEYGNWTRICTSKFEVYFNSDINIALKEAVTEFSAINNHNYYLFLNHE